MKPLHLHQQKMMSLPRKFDPSAVKQQNTDLKFYKNKQQPKHQQEMTKLPRHCDPLKRQKRQRCASTGFFASVSSLRLEARRHHTHQVADDDGTACIVTEQTKFSIQFPRATIHSSAKPLALHSRSHPSANGLKMRQDTDGPRLSTWRDKPDLGAGGTMFTCGGMSMEPVAVATSQLIFKDLRFVECWHSRRMVDGNSQKSDSK
jgi:hypothetical protein